MTLINFSTPPDMAKYWAQIFGSGTCVCPKCGEEMLVKSSSLPDYEVGIEFDTAPMILDIGACLGAYARWARTRWPGNVTHCYEPNPNVHRLLEKNLTHVNGEYAIHKVAVVGSKNIQTDEARPDTVRLYTGKNNIGETSIYPEAAGRYDEFVEVPVVFAKDLPDCDVMKLDCEGPEREILAEYLATHEAPAAVAVEYHTAAESVALQKLMLTHGYRLNNAREKDLNHGVITWRHEPEVHK